MNEHHRRITRRIFDAITECQNGTLGYTSLKTIIAAHLSAVDTAYPSMLKGELEQLVSNLFEHFGEPNEHEMVALVFNEIKATILQYL